MAASGFPHCAIFPTAASRRSLVRFSIPMWLIVLSNQLEIIGLVSRYLPNCLIPSGRICSRAALRSRTFPLGLTRYYRNFRSAIPLKQAASQTLLTRPPLVSREASFPLLPYDLHVLSLPPAFNLSHDQTLHFKVLAFASPFGCSFYDSEF